MSQIVWDKMRVGLGYPVRAQHELIMYASKVGAKVNFRKHGDYQCCPSVAKFKPVSNQKRIHASQKPVELLEFLIRGFSDEGDTVLDTFAGSGSVAAAALSNNRRHISYELDSEVCARANHRLDTIRFINPQPASPTV